MTPLTLVHLQCMLNYADKIQDHIFKTIAEVSRKASLKTYIIGGYVRDLVLERASKDVDFVVVGSGIALARKVAEALGQETFARYFKILEQQ